MMVVIKLLVEANCKNYSGKEHLVGLKDDSVVKSTLD